MSGLQERIEALVAGRRVMVVGVGNTLRADDGVGPCVAAGLAGLHPGRALDAGPVPENFLDPILARAPEVVLFVDAADHGGAPGAWCLAPVHDLEARVSSTHGPSLRLLASLLEAGGARCWFVGVQPASLEHGRAMDGTVRESGERLVRALARALMAESAHA